jgi:hypothetical protein
MRDTMEKVPKKEQIGLLTYEIYEKSACRDDDDTLIWLCPEEESTNPDGQVETNEYLSLDHQYKCGPEPMLYDLPVQPVGITPDTTYLDCSKTDVQCLSPKIPEHDRSSAGIADIETTSLLTYQPIEQFKLCRWIFRVSAFACMLLIGNLFPAILEQALPSRAKASAPIDGGSARTYRADRQGGTRVRVLTVMASRTETIKDISIRYIGDFDQDLLDEIRSLNPTLKDPDHLEDGQLIRIPLRPRHGVTD